MSMSLERKLFDIEDTINICVLTKQFKVLLIVNRCIKMLIHLITAEIAYNDQVKKPFGIFMYVRSAVTLISLGSIENKTFKI